MVRSRRKAYRVSLRHRLRSFVRRASRTDGLTGLGTRQALEHDLAKLLRETSVSLVVFDVDGMKRIGDWYGIGPGDAVLRELAGLVRDEATRWNGRGYRCGGDQFALVLPGIAKKGAAEAEEAAEAVRKRFAGSSISIHGLAEPVRDVTVTAGGTCTNDVHAYSRPYASQIAHSLFQRALIEVGKAKEAGGNCVRIRL